MLANFLRKIKVSIFVGNGGHWINLSNIQSGGDCYKLSRCHWHFMKRERERDGKNGRKRSLLFFNDQLLKIQSYGRVRTMSKRNESIKISWSHKNLQIVLHNLLCFLLYQNSEKVITNIFTIKVWCSSLMCEWFLPSESYDTSGGKLRWWEKKVVAQKEESQFSLSHHFHSWFHKKINL